MPLPRGVHCELLIEQLFSQELVNSFLKNVKQIRSPNYEMH